jgi:ankyrin repeat protein
VQLLLDKSDEDAENDSGNTPAWLALGNGHLEVAKTLFEGGADLNLVCEDGKTYIHQVRT